MNKFSKSFKFTYFGKISSKSFVLISILLIILVVLAFNADKLADLFNSKEKIGIVTSNKDISKEIKKNKKDFFDKDTSIERYNQETAEKKLKNGDLDYILKISFKDKVYGQLESKDQPDHNMKNNINNLLNTLQYKQSLGKLTLSKQEIESLNKTSDFTTKVNDDKGKISQKEKDFQLVFTVINLIIMLFIIMNYVNQLAMEVAIEKTSRVIEMIITSIKPSVHITAKILGIFSVALTQILLLLITIGICLIFFDVHSALNRLNLKVTTASIDLIIYNIIFWIIGIVSYSLISSILGSLTSRIEDIGQSLMPLLFILLGSFYIVVFSISNPNNSFVNISSYIPLVSPFTMLLRIANNSVSTTEIIISIILSIVFVIICFYIAARSYKHSVLTYDKNILNVIKKVSSK